jgi:hypothetical protein
MRTKPDFATVILLQSPEFRRNVTVALRFGSRCQIASRRAGASAGCIHDRSVTSMLCLQFRDWVIRAVHSVDLIDRGHHFEGNGT